MQAKDSTMTKLADFIGKEVTLIEKPDGYASSNLQMEVGGKFHVKDVNGCCLVVKLPDGLNGHINYKRFKETKDL